MLTLTSRSFDVLNGELVDIAEYAVDKHKQCGRLPKLAVDASCWWYANMTAAMAQALGIVSLLSTWWIYCSADQLFFNRKQCRL